MIRSCPLITGQRLSVQCDSGAFFLSRRAPIIGVHRNGKWWVVLRLCDSAVLFFFHRCTQINTDRSDVGRMVEKLPRLFRGDQIALSRRVRVNDLLTTMILIMEIAIHQSDLIKNIGIY